jgi:DNA processing protein
MNHLVPWLTLKSVPGIGNLLFRRLILQFKTPEAVFSASHQALASVQGMTERLATAIIRHRTPDWVSAEIEIAAKKGWTVITQTDRLFPQLLLQIPDPPPFLFAKGRPDFIIPAVAVVGSRKATSYGLTTTRKLCEGLAAHGITVVSGMAKGIDTAAHQSTLAAGGHTVAVLGTGLNYVYPAENLKLFNRMAEKGAVVTEFWSNDRPDAHHFPMRNRVISGMTLGTVVVEAAKRSGSLITARLAAEQGREVFAVPGNVHAATTQGTHNLIQQGAKLVHCVEDILEELGTGFEQPDKPLEKKNSELKKDRPALPSELEPVFRAIGAYPVHIDELSRLLNMDVGKLTSALIQLEINGLICQEPGHYYIRHMDFIEE